MSEKSEKRVIHPKYAVEQYIGRDNVAKVRLIEPDQAPKGANLYTADEVIKICAERGLAAPYSDPVAGRPISRVDRFGFRLNRYRKPYIAPADVGSGARAKREKTFL